MANLDEVRTLKERIRKDLGGVDILVNNAAISPDLSLLRGQPEEIARLIRVNLLSQFWVTFLAFHLRF